VRFRASALANDRFSVTLLGSFGGVGLLLAGVGLYGVMAFSVTERRREVAIRVALSAAPHRVLTLVVREGALSWRRLRCRVTCRGAGGSRHATCSLWYPSDGLRDARDRERGNDCRSDSRLLPIREQSCGSKSGHRTAL